MSHLFISFLNGEEKYNGSTTHCVSFCRELLMGQYRRSRSPRERVAFGCYSVPNTYIVKGSHDFLNEFLDYPVVITPAPLYTYIYSVSSEQTKDKANIYYLTLAIMLIRGVTFQRVNNGEKLVPISSMDEMLKVALDKSTHNNFSDQYYDVVYSMFPVYYWKKTGEKFPLERQYRSYVNGISKYVRNRLVDLPGQFKELFKEYVREYNILDVYFGTRRLHMLSNYLEKE